MTIPCIPEGYFCLESFMGRALKSPGGELMVNVLTGYSSQNIILDVEGSPNDG